MKYTKILSAFLAFLMMCSILTAFSAVEVSAAYEDKIDEDGNPVIDYYSKAYTSPASKLKDMTMMKEANGYRIWIEEFTGEIAFENVTTGQVLFSNPYDVSAGTTTVSKTVKQELLSQIMLEYQDNGVAKTMNSYFDAALRGQIEIKNIKNGVRVEYTIGELETIRLVPRRIEKSRFESIILANIDDGINYDKLISFYTLYDTKDPALTERQIKEMEAAFPITKSKAIYVCDPGIGTKHLRQLESIIKTYCPLYTYEEMDQDHNDTGYVGTDKAPPNFKMALEYKIAEDGSLDVRLPANGIRFDESIYQLDYVTVLPYMGAGNGSYNTGYNFIPDGSGALIRFEDVVGISYNVSGQMYGADYAYHTITGQHAEEMRYPVFGTVTNLTATPTAASATTTTATSSAAAAAAADKTVTVSKQDTAANATVTAQDVGFAAIITEGDSMATIMSSHGGIRHPYNSVYARFYPRPSDTYNLADSISLSGVGTNASWTVVSSRKYTGSYRIKYVMLTDEKLATKNKITDYYDCSYVGMATAYRDYLENIGVIKKLTKDDVKSDIPLYIESFGSLETTERVFSFPVTVDTPLTTFEDVMTMYDELSSEGITNINFKLTGFSNGGLSCTYPAKISWTKALGGKSGFTTLSEYAAEKGFGLYPEFDFVYAGVTDWFDGVGMKHDAVKTIDNRYTSRRYYDSATQSFEKDTGIAISASTYEYFFEKFSKAYSKYNPVGVSASTLGTDLNSDFDKSDPYNREDSKGFTTDMLSNLKTAYGSVMVDGGNAYTLPYVSHILNMSTDSSKFLKASDSVPFSGMVLHGFVNFAGNAINMEGDVSSSILKAIENGAGLYFVLSYENTEELKGSDLFNKYFSVDYNIWKEDILEKYTTLNDAVGSLQTTLITDHDFIQGYRIPSEDEVAADEAEEKELEERRAANQKALEEKAARKALLEARKNGATTPEDQEALNAAVAEIETNDEQAEAEAISEETQQLKDKYLTSTGTVVLVTYDDGTSFILNYNSFEIQVIYDKQTYEVDSLGFVKIG